MIERRLKALAKAIKEEEVDAFLIEDPINLYYFTGLQLSAGSLIATEKGAYLFVDGRYIQRAQMEKHLKVFLSDGKTFEREILSLCKNSLGFDSKKTSYDRYVVLEKLLYPEKSSLELKAINGLCDKIRAIKDEDELKKIQKSADLLLEGFEHLKKSIKVGIEEKELAQALHIFALEKGASGLAFESIIAFNENAAMPHHRASHAKLKPNSLILVDIGLMIDGYASDMTRVLFFGTPEPKLEKAYFVLRAIHEKVLMLLRPKVEVKSLHEFVIEELEREGYGGLMTHSLGHGVGLEVHEYPKLSNKTSASVVLEENMVITIEPGIYLPGIGGIRYEDLVVITKNGYKNFYRNLNSDKVNLNVT